MTFSTKISSLAVLLVASLSVVQAQVAPSEPGPASSFNAGEPCNIVWTGDSESPSDWKDMSIQLMTGDNFNMQHVTTVATEQDGTADGRFSYTCPEVAPYGAIYFYQFSSPHTTTKTWTTRFTIASPSGETSPPENANQPGTNDPIPWGVGALVDASAAVPPPDSDASSDPAGPETGSNTTTTASPEKPTLTPTPKPTTSAPTSRIVTSASSSTPASTPSGTAANQENGALGPLAGINGAMLATAVLMVAAPLWL